MVPGKFVGGFEELLLVCDCLKELQCRSCGRFFKDVQITLGCPLLLNTFRNVICSSDLAKLKNMALILLCVNLPDSLKSI